MCTFVTRVHNALSITPVGRPGIGPLQLVSERNQLEEFYQKFDDCEAMSRGAVGTANFVFNDMSLEFADVDPGESKFNQKVDRISVTTTLLNRLKMLKKHHDDLIDKQ
ncbi:hypothetical protein YC2023_117235 [Brassica napus]